MQWRNDQCQPITGTAAQNLARACAWTLACPKCPLLEKRVPFFCLRAQRARSQNIFQQNVGSVVPQSKKRRSLSGQERLLGVTLAILATLEVRVWSDRRRKAALLQLQAVPLRLLVQCYGLGREGGGGGGLSSTVHHRLESYESAADSTTSGAGAVQHSWLEIKKEASHLWGNNATRWDASACDPVPESSAPYNKIEGRGE